MGSSSIKVSMSAMMMAVSGSMLMGGADAATRISECGDSDCYIGTIVPIGCFVLFLIFAVVYLMCPPNYKENRIEMEARAKAAKQRQQDIQKAIEELDTKEALARGNSSFASNKDKAE